MARRNSYGSHEALPLIKTTSGIHLEQCQCQRDLRRHRVINYAPEQMTANAKPRGKGAPGFLSKVLRVPLEELVQARPHDVGGEVGLVIERVAQRRSCRRAD